MKPTIRLRGRCYYPPSGWGGHDFVSGLVRLGSELIHTELCSPVSCTTSVTSLSTSPADRYLVSITFCLAQDSSHCVDRATMPAL
jgi:hypothetical protein